MIRNDAIEIQAEPLKNDLFVFKFGNDFMFADTVELESVNLFIKLISSELVQLDNYFKHVELLEQQLPEFTYPFIIYFNSDGGEVTAGFALYDFLMRLKTRYTIPFKLKTCATGLTASMASLLYLAGDERYITPHAQVMIHALTGGTYGKYQDAKSQMKQLDILNDQIKRLLKVEQV